MPARQILQQLTERAEREYVSPYWLGLVNLGLGRPSAALSWLEAVG